LTTAGGSRTVSFFDIKEKRLNFEVKNSAFWIDFEKYLSHHSNTVIVVDHSDCGFWPKYIDSSKEINDHAKSLKVAERIIKENYPEIEKIILLYVTLNENTDEVIDISKVLWHQHKLVLLTK